MAEVIVVDNGVTESKKRRWWLWIPLTIVGFLAVAIGIFVIWALNPMAEIGDEALMALQSDDNITVTDRAWLAFVPQNSLPNTGFIFYPGGRVPAEAYAPIARQIAEEGYLSIIVYAPLNLAIFNTDLAQPVITQFSAIENWVVSGHSLGGSAAAIFTENNPDLVDGVAFLASYPINDSLASLNMPIISIYGTNDGLATVEDIDASRPNLPNATFIEIEGGNHAQFGYYGSQSGDNPATISHDEQINQTIEALLDLLSIIDEQP